MLYNIKQKQKKAKKAKKKLRNYLKITADNRKTKRKKTFFYKRE